MDVKTAFLNENLKEEIYMRIPEGVINEEGAKDKVFRLNKSLYGLKQAARCWFDGFDAVIRNYVFESSEVERCIYILKGNSINDYVFILLYVDDLLICTGYEKKLNNVKEYLMSQFAMVDMKEARFFLGVRIERTKDRIMLDQSAYINSMLEKFSMGSCRPSTTPIETKPDHIKLSSPIECNAPIRSAVGTIMHLMLFTRPDISFSTSFLARYVKHNNKEVWEALKRMVRYLKGIVYFKLTKIRKNIRMC